MPAEIDKHLLDLGFDITKHTNAMLSYYDKNLICRFANNAYLDWLGLYPEDMINKMHIRDILGPLYEKNLSHINGALNGKVQVFERPILMPSGITKNARATYFPDFENGKVKGFYVHVADVSPLPGMDGLFDAETENIHLFSNGHLLDEVVETLKSCILTGFPGISNLSKKHFISESKLKRDFKEKYNTTIFSFYRDIQMELAYKYIHEKRCNKNQMAIMLNFSNPSNFSVCYQKYLKEKSSQDIIREIKKVNDERYRTFITQAPVAIAMFDNNMLFMAASQKWISDFRLQHIELIGKSVYEVIPGIELKYKDLLLECLNGDTNHCDEAFIERPDGTPAWLRWDIKPWHKEDNEIGGLLIFTEDITALKLKESENKQILEVLNKTNEITRIGAWQRNFRNNTNIWSKILKDMLEVPQDFNPDLATAIKFYKEGESRDLAEKGLKDALENGKSFDVELDMITGKGNLIRVRLIGYPEFLNGKCEKISGIFQDIT